MTTAKTTTTTAKRTNATARKVTGNVLALYASYLANWPTGKVGPKPTAADFELAHQIGAKPGSKYAMAWAMYLRPIGATRGEVSAICDGPQFNRANDAVNAGQAVWQAVEPRGPNNRSTVYKLALPTKAKAKRKASAKRKAQPKAQPDTTATN